MGSKIKYSRLELLVYAIGWILVFLAPISVELYGMLSGEIDTFHFNRVLNAEILVVEIFALFLLNNFVLLPQLFFKNQKIWYFVILIVCFVILWYIQEPPMPKGPALGKMPMGPRPVLDMFHISNLIIEFCVILANFAIKVYVESLRRDMLMLNIQNEKMATELESLKYQISPHFLMNTLNNIQSLIESNPTRAYFTIQGLSRIMRYLLYENSNMVSLQKEVDFMTDFINLMKIRYPDNLQISVHFPMDCNQIMVPPLLFISFLENAFKHGVSYKEESFISINMSVEGDHLLFKCANSQAGNKPKSSDRKGIGLENIKRRLQLIYKNNYELKISNTEKLYIVEIDLPLDNIKENIK